MDVDYGLDFFFLKKVKFLFFEQVQYWFHFIYERRQIIEGWWKYKFAKNLRLVRIISVADQWSFENKKIKVGQNLYFVFEIH